MQFDFLDDRSHFDVWRAKMLSTKATIGNEPVTLRKRFFSESGRVGDLAVAVVALSTWPPYLVSEHNALLKRKYDEFGTIFPDATVIEEEAVSLTDA